MILACGDTHGSQKALEKIADICKSEQPDMLVHTGDNFRDYLWLKKQLNCQGYGVRGNCDFGLLPGALEEQIIEYKSKKILVAHGHLHGVKTTYKIILNRAKEISADVVIFGHTHLQYAQKHDGVWLINPGSPSLPRGGTPGYAKIFLGADELGAELAILS